MIGNCACPSLCKTSCIPLLSFACIRIHVFVCICCLPSVAVIVACDPEVFVAHDIARPNACYQNDILTISYAHVTLAIVRQAPLKQTQHEVAICGISTVQPLPSPRWGHHGGDDASFAQGAFRGDHRFRSMGKHLQEASHVFAIESWGLAHLFAFYWVLYKLNMSFYLLNQVLECLISVGPGMISTNCICFDCQRSSTDSTVSKRSRPINCFNCVGVVKDDAFWCFGWRCSLLKFNPEIPAGEWRH